MLQVGGKIGLLETGVLAEINKRAVREVCSVESVGTPDAHRASWGSWMAVDSTKKPTQPTQGPIAEAFAREFISSVPSRTHAHDCTNHNIISRRLAQPKLESAKIIGKHSKLKRCYARTYV